MVKFHWVTLIFIYLVVVAGSVVRMTGSGMGCPDWPKCFDQYIPPTSAEQLPENYQKYYSLLRAKKINRFAQFLKTVGMNDKADALLADKSLLIEQEFNTLNTWFEYVNRLIGALAGVFIFIGFLLSWKSKDQKRKKIIFSFLLVVLTAFQAWWGAMVVATNIVPWVLTVHMVIAALMIAWQLKIISIYQNTSFKSLALLKWASGIGIVFYLVQIVLGTQVRQIVDHWLVAHSREDLLFQDYSIFLFHRTYAILLVAYALFLGLYNYVKKLHLKSIYLFLIVILMEGTIGKLLADFDIPHLLQSLHLVFALLAFGILVRLYLNLRVLK